MRTLVACVLLSVVYSDRVSFKYDNVTFQPTARQLLEFKQQHPLPTLWTKDAGDPTEIRDIQTINSDQFNNQLLLDTMLSFDGERIPERRVHAKGHGAFGYLEVTNDVSKYTYADVFNGIGKKTPVVVRFSTARQGFGGSDVSRELKGMAVKFYTKEGNLDLTCLQTPVYFYRDPILFQALVHVFRRNPKTNVVDSTSMWDFLTLRPALLHTVFWITADYGIPNGYRRMDAFPIHTFEIANKNGGTHYVRFNFRTEQGVASLTTEQAAEIQSRDLDYFNRDLYNAIENKNFPSWRLEMDVITARGIQRVDYDPFDVTRLWKNGTYHTVTIGRLTLNRNVENQFKDIEQGAFNPANLVPGIPGPVDFLFRGRRMFYRDTQNYRLGRNHDKILVNQPLYAKKYTRDGIPPLLDNGRDAPNYYPNSFNGPAPYVDDKRPWQKLQVLESNAIDFQPLNYFYTHILEDEAHRQRFVSNLVLSLVEVTPPVTKRALKTLYLIDPELGKRVAIGLEVARAQARAQQLAQAATPSPTNITNVPTAENDCYY